MIHEIMNQIVNNPVLEEIAFLIIDSIIFAIIMWFLVLEFKRQRKAGWSIENAKWKFGMKNESVLKKLHGADHAFAVRKKA